MAQIPNFHHAASSAELAGILAAFVSARLCSAVQLKGRALLVVSGGSTPVPFFERLAIQSLDWSRVSIVLADERWLPPDHADSNEALVRRHLLQGAARQAHFQPLYVPGLTPSEACQALARPLEALPWPAEVVVLGMGGDGHTASWFPHDAAWLDASAARCLPVLAPVAPNVPVPRISLSPAALLDAHCVALHIVGAGKMATLQEALREGAEAELPIRRVLRLAAAPCEVFCAP